MEVHDIRQSASHTLFHLVPFCNSSVCPGQPTCATRPTQRYRSPAARQQYDLISSNEALVTTTAAFGNGTYTLQGNAIAMIQDDRQNQPETGFIRIEEESKDEGRTWAPILYLLRVSTVDGQDYEVRYQRTR
jgi:hypothetical protein